MPLLSGGGEAATPSERGSGVGRRPVTKKRAMAIRARGRVTLSACWWPVAALVFLLLSFAVAANAKGSQPITVGGLLESVTLANSPADDAAPTPEPGSEPEPEVAKPAFVLPEIPAPVAKGPVIISEFMASNEATLKDEAGAFPDWIELQNVSPSEVDLAGWQLTADPSRQEGWAFPKGTVLPPQQYLVVFASGKGGDGGDGETLVGASPKKKGLLHTNFKLKSKGGYLGLVDSKGAVASEYAGYPPQYEDVAFGKAGSSSPLRTFITRTKDEAAAGSAEKAPGGAPSSFGYVVFSALSLSLSLSLFPYSL